MAGSSSRESSDLQTLAHASATSRSLTKIVKLNSGDTGVVVNSYS